MANITLRGSLARPLTTAEMDGNLSALNNELVAATAAIASLVTQMAQKANTSALTAGLAGKANLAHTHSILDVSGLQAALDAKLGVSQLGQPNFAASLDANGKVPASQLPAAQITEFLGTVANEAAMLALPGGDPGDWCVRQDTGTTWLLRSAPASVLSNWQELAYPTAPVTSVNAKVGAVVLNKGDIGLANVDNTTDLAKPISTAAQLALNGKASLAHSHIISDVSGLQAALDSKAASGHTHAISAVTGLQAELDSKAPTVHQHSIAAVTGLQAAIDGKQATLAFQDGGVDAGGPITTINFVGFSVTRTGGTLTVQLAQTSNGILTRLGDRLLTRSGDALIWR